MSGTIIDTSDMMIYLGKGDTATDAEKALAELIIPLSDGVVRQVLGYSVNQAEYTHFLPDENMYGLLTNYVDVINNRVNFDGWSGTTILALPEIPVRSITAIYSDMSAFGGQAATDFPPSTLLVQGTDFYMDDIIDGVSWTGFIRRYYTNWPARARAVKAVYTAGFTDAELDGNGQVGGKRPGNIKMAAIIAAALEFNKAQVAATGGSGAITAEKLGDYSVAYAKESAAFFSGMTQVQLPPQASALLQPFKRFKR